MIFERALRRELLNAAGAVFTTLFTITITFMLIRILAQAAGGKVASEDVLILIGFASLDYLPILLVLTGFMSILMAVTRAYQDSEMVVWFASGVSLTQWIAPVLRFGAPIIMLIAALSLVVSPWATQQSNEIRARYEKREDIARVAPGRFQESQSAERISFVEEVAGDLSKLQNIFINSTKNGRNSVIVAKEGKIEIQANGDRFLVMSQGRRYDGLPTDPDFQMMQFEKYGVLVATKNKAASGYKSAKSTPLHILLAERSFANYAELLWRISLPIMGIVLMVLAIPLGHVNPRVGRSANLIIALILVVLYLNLLNIMQASVTQGRVSFMYAWWPMHLFILSLAGVLFAWRLQVNSRLHPLVIWSNIKCTVRRQGARPA